ncbi:MAG: hypothetical protein ACYS9V_12565 [Planctomycetota bacterium]|jgi:hypothetical protein
MGSASITNEEFKELIDMRSQPLLGLVNYLRRCQPGDNIGSVTEPIQAA